MPFVGDIFSQLNAAPANTVLQEIRDGKLTAVAGPGLLSWCARRERFLVSKGLEKGERCGILAPNSIRWIAWIWRLWRKD